MELVQSIAETGCILEYDQQNEGPVQDALLSQMGEEKGPSNNDQLHPMRRTSGQLTIDGACRSVCRANK